MYTTEQLNAMKATVISQMKLAQLPVRPENIKSDVGQCRTTTAYAYCRYTPRQPIQFEIRISKYAMGIDEVAMRNTICHELIHTLPDCQDHGYLFQHYANVMNKTYGYSVQTKGCIDSNGKQARMGKPQFKYKVVCTKCGASASYYRASKVVYNPERFRCGRCGNKELKVITL